MRDSVDLAMEDISPFQGVHLHHIARETSDVHCLLDFYQQLPCLQICDFVMLYFTYNLCRQFPLLNQRSFR